MFDTIAAISTAISTSAISIIRVSGPKAIEIVNKTTKIKITKQKTHTIKYNHIVENKKTIDEVLITIMKAPKTFTKEDIVEINCHGGIATTNKVLELILTKGARIAEPGEFTKRAFLNNRIDLIEAESIMQIISAKTEKSRQLAMNGIKGKISIQIKELRKKLLEIITNIEVNIDYPEYEDILQITNNMIKKETEVLKKNLTKILKESENGMIIKDGINILILGKPNVGKSSILNNLIEQEKAIVTDIKGTTRDIVEGSINLDGIMLNFMDTAGIRNTKNKIETIGVTKSIEKIKEADLIIVVLNNNEKINNDDKKILELTKTKKRIIFINKTDLESKLETNTLNKDETVQGNTIKKEGLNNLKEKIKELFNLKKLETEDLNYLSNSRQISLIKKSLENVTEIEKSIKNNYPIDIIEINIKEIYNLLGEIIGENYNNDIINNIFENFCLGK